MTILSVDQLSYRYSASLKPVLENIHLQIGKGDFVLLTGSNGSGKTTLLKILTGVIPKFSGGILQGSRQTENTKNIDPHKIGVVFQGLDNQFIHSRVDQEILSILENQQKNESSILETFEKLVRQFGISHILKKNIASLSSGEKQLLKITLAFLFSPEIILMDEPLSHLDITQRKKILRILKEIKEQNHLTFVIADHEPDAWKIFGDQIQKVVLGPFKPNFEKNNESITQRYGTNRLLMSIENLDFSHPDTNLFNNFTNHIYAGECIAISGKNGSGKTTLQHLLMGHIQPNKGKIQKHVPDLAIKSLVNPTIDNFFSMKLSEELLLNHKALPNPTVFGMHAYYDRYMYDLSQGEQQKAALECLMDDQTSIFILDEPFLYLDDDSKRVLEHQIAKLQQSGAAVLITTHHPDSFHNKADQVWLLDR